MSVWNTQIPQVQDGDPVNAESVNLASAALAAQTLALKEMIDSIRSRQFIAAEEIPLAQDVAVGDLVYLNSTSQVGEKALAVWQDLQTNGGRVVPAESAVHLGVVIKKDSVYAGDVSTEGMVILETTALENLLGASPAPGIYYLSSTEAGKATAQPPATASRAVQYFGNNLLRVFPPQNEPITHNHLKYELISGDWLAAGTFDPDIVPAGANFGYDMLSANSLSENLPELLVAAVGVPSFYNKTSGVLLDEDLFIITPEGIWYTDASAPTDPIIAHATSADAKEVKILHSARSPLGTVTLSEKDGRLDIDITPYSTQEDTTGAIVVKELAGGILKRGPVVENILAGMGMNITSTIVGGKGTVTVGAALYDNLRLSAKLTNLNNAITSQEGVFTVVTMPANRAQSLHCMVPIPNLGTGNHTCKIYMKVIGSSEGDPLPEITVNLLEDPPAGGALPVVSLATGAVPHEFEAVPVGADPLRVYTLEILEEIQLVDLGNTIDFGRGTFYFTLSFDPAPGTDLKIVDTGIRLIQE